MISINYGSFYQMKNKLLYMSIHARYIKYILKYENELKRYFTRNIRGGIKLGSFLFIVINNVIYNIYYHTYS